jgi:hypothetical protein
MLESTNQFSFDVAWLSEIYGIGWYSEQDTQECAYEQGEHPRESVMNQPLLCHTYDQSMTAAVAIRRAFDAVR